MNGDDGFFDDDSIDEGKFIENLFGKNKNNRQLYAKELCFLSIARL